MRIEINDHDFFYRKGTSDEAILSQFINSPERSGEYAFPKDFEPKVIFDIGANIGVAAIFMAEKYPNAKIHCFEPEKENYELLLKNINPYPNIASYNIGLGRSKSLVYLSASDDPKNFGGFSIFNEGTDPKNRSIICLQPAQEWFDKLGPVDLVKSDCEGAEFEIFDSLSSEAVASIRVITGEMHGQKDYELFKALENHGFGLAFHKSLGQRCYPFLAYKAQPK